LEALGVKFIPLGILGHLPLNKDWNRGPEKV